MNRRCIVLAAGAILSTPLCVGQTASCQLAKLMATPARREQAGQSVAIGGDSILVSVPGELTDGIWGAARIYHRQGAAWLLTAIVQATDAVPPNGFGDAAAMSEDGTRALVGAPLDLIADAVDGSVYVYERLEGLGWSQIAKLTATQPDPDPSRNEYFGQAVAIDGSRIIVGAYGDTAVYVFEESESGTWLQTARLTPYPYGWYFGFSVSLHGDMAVVGAPYDFAQGQYAGAAFVFERGETGVWTQTARLLPNPGNQQGFGWSVAITSNAIFVGVPGDDTAGESAGAVYIFTRGASGDWAQSEQLLGPGDDLTSSFGACIAIDQGYAIIGDESYADARTGAAFVFRCDSDGSWNYLATITASQQSGSRFGRTVALNGSVAVIGAPFQDEPGIEDAGAAYVFAVGSDSDGDGVIDVCQCRAAGDLDFNGFIDLSDLVVLLSSFGLDTGGDLDSSEETDLQDLATLLGHISTPCP